MLFSIKSYRGLTSIYQTSGNFLYTAASDYFSSKGNQKKSSGSHLFASYTNEAPLLYGKPQKL